MEYNGVKYELSQTANRADWKWVAHISATRPVMGFSSSEEIAVHAAKRAIEKSMQHRDVQFSVALIERGLWKWEFRIGDKVKTGKIKTMFKEMAAWRVRDMINRELRKVARQDAAE